MIPRHWVRWWRHWYNIGLVIHMSRAPVLARQYCAVALGKLLTHMCL